MDIGNKLKNLRIQQSLTQEELADRSELTKGFISQVERNLTSPSIATLIDILEALGTTPYEFFDDNSEEKIVFKEEDYFESNKENGYKMKWIVPNAQKNEMEPIILELENKSISKSISPFDGEILGYVLMGSVVLHYGDKKHEVNKGETFYFRADKESYLENKKSKSAKVIYVSSPPNF
ncbi:transcriptional regulator, XRE family with cupin sensor [Anaerosphaera aminiphila DSM 21120]|uniref:Transcriptional regulator, XRE family with cupin sensor n=1 Tax=Anaerosphaera aminiphila DSM 21120 TaxID=1120995 RepID=A0A1M5UWD7_9FIRM|nr:XRE family transcriptional regulator [Anaerosphaera aminiphila]SHH67269.1 transcriptional regulator, XRE family with cupin sensor [Anaerosphaera aminiphila DSM 21120]